ncbi:hypothetical protein JG687_00005169 [Phytophthora cactorum]|uniref:Uncharacterized protein n=1 Tax=Phytophthora cactorum TaxID=29920 RepID=A0A8T1UNX9_9STRA|nr:hypothetical protein PC120_g5571 [Phytophthora cactorum]KAG3091576.1 hypothetical protein PC121_g3802 [Phytophthora cactorum]KAG3194184.1 hypothetical protein PC128_g9577 [Phytophthora cactorum]KAG4057877.1 hypothetical protein PC123_g7133 [Phytophthora cactorum]KAG6965887.1 hypothetical protein JG687_00005169 [Phytophthora cactorum]
MSDSPWNAAPVPGQDPHPPKPAAAHAPHAKKEEHVVWNAAPKPNASTGEKIKDKTRHVVEDAKDLTAKVTSTVEGYKNDSVAKVKKIKEERKVAKEEKKSEKKKEKKEKKAEESAGACGLCGCTVM